MLEVLVHRSFLGSRSLVLLLAFFALVTHLVAGQTINGQTFTNGLAVIDAPSPNNPGHAGSTIPIAVDVSGNGQLQSAASLPGSGLPTSYESMEIYLVSAETNVNTTVSTGPAFLTGEGGSTVKHLNWPIPTCIPQGNYNLTFYETSNFNGQGVFTITSIPIPISNTGAPAQCPDLNPLQPQPQDSSPLPQSPFAPGSPISISSSRMVTVIGAGPNPTLTLTLTISGGVLDLPTVTVTASAKPTPTTVVLVSLATVTETDQGKVTTFTQTSTLTTVVAAPSQTGGQSNTQDTSGFIPVNAGSRLICSMSLCLFFGAWTLSCVLLY
ncbi:hypothetical protein B0H17DRAFT_1037019 [Mycena rosella]|uniref:Uncharacterized protein n=1 Tax=Mycena rosella TaxID=1033263 RepID=A0AAD7GVT6_MYCRO|nr:hypothetical protein B0H17DRAFT_1037019 [Mycena rosella]